MTIGLHASSAARTHRALDLMLRHMTSKPNNRFARRREIAERAGQNASGSTNERQRRRRKPGCSSASRDNATASIGRKV